MEYVILIIVIAVLALGTGGWLLFVRPRRGRISAPSGPPPSLPTTTASPSAPAAEETGEAGKPQATAGIIEIERPPPSAGRMVRLLSLIHISEPTRPY